MNLGEMLQQVASESGYSVTGDRDLLVSYINRAGEEIYNIADWPGSLREVVLKATPNSTVACPSFIGFLRGLRGYTNYEKVKSVGMLPRYIDKPWPQMGYNWRVKYRSPLFKDIDNAAQLTITVKAVETDPVIIYITGATEDSNKVTESVTLDAVSKNTVNSFISVESITKSRVNDYNISIYDIDEELLSVIDNDKLSVGYLIIDVSEFPNETETPAGERYVECLYKPTYMPLNADGDEYQCKDLSQAVVYKALEYTYYSIRDGTAKAMDYFNKCNQILNDKYADANKGTVRRIVPTLHKFFNIC